MNKSLYDPAAPSSCQCHWPKSVNTNARPPYLRPSAPPTSHRKIPVSALLAGEGFSAVRQLACQLASRVELTSKSNLSSASFFVLLKKSFKERRSACGFRFSQISSGQHDKRLVCLPPAIKKARRKRISFTNSKSKSTFQRTPTRSLDTYPHSSSIDTEAAAEPLTESSSHTAAHRRRHGADRQPVAGGEQYLFFEYTVRRRRDVGCDEE